MRVIDAKQPGRKHNHQPSTKIVQARTAGKKKWAAMNAKKSQAYKIRVRAYWRGELDNHP